MERVASGPSVGDLYPATMAVVGILGALHHASATGDGQFLDVAMVDSLMALCESMTWRYTYTGEVQSPRGSEHASLCPFELYDTSDGQVAIAAPVSGHWAELCRIIGRTDMIDDERFSSARRRVLVRDEVTEIITNWTAKQDKGRRWLLSWVAGCLWGRSTMRRICTTTSTSKPARCWLPLTIRGPNRPVLTPNTPIRFTETPGGIYRRAPLLGEHTDEILAELDELVAES